MLIELGKVNVPVKPEQHEKAPFPIDVTEFGMDSEPLKPEQLLKAYSPIV